MFLVSVIVSVTAIMLTTIKGFDATDDQAYCTYFGNRASQPQPDLMNCTWFKQNSCCFQQEIERIFVTMKPLSNASQSCQHHMNYLMCYICDPNQSVFYRDGYLTVCEEFCDALYTACSGMVLEESMIGEVYQNGTDFCNSRRFKVQTTQCYNYDWFRDLYTSSSHRPALAQEVLGFWSLAFLFLVYGSFSSCVHDLMFLLKKRFGLWEIKSHPIRQNSLTRHAFINLGVIKVLLFVGVFSQLRLVNGATQEILSKHSIVNLSQNISQQLRDLFDNSLGYKKLQNYFDEAEYVNEDFSGTATALEVRRKLDVFFTHKRELVQALATEVRLLHDESISENVTGNNLTYYDADLPHTLPLHLLRYKSEFESEVIEEHSTIKIPDAVRRKKENIVRTIKWTSDLDPIFRANREYDPHIRWQYFGASTGLHRVFPGREWSRNFIGFHDDYDPRTRPWYQGATSQSRDIVIIIDISTSMETGKRFFRAKSAAITLLNLLTHHDKVKVIASSSSYWTTSGTYVDISHKTLGCDGNELRHVTNSHRNLLVSQIESLMPHGGSDHMKAFKEAFQLLRKQQHSSSNCRSFVAFITDGETIDGDQRCSAGSYRYDEEGKRRHKPGPLCRYDYNSLSQAISLWQTALSVKVPHHQPLSKVKASIFTFLVDGDSPSDSLHSLSCAHYGRVTLINDDTDIIDQMAGCLTQSEAQEDHNVHWTSPYIDQGDLGLMITVSAPVYSNLTHRLVGVVGVDVPLTYLYQQLIFHPSTSSSTYFFLVDTRDATAVIHPRATSSSQLVEEPLFVPITELENLQGELGQSLLTELESQLDHKDIITQDAHYFYAKIPGTSFVVVLRTSGSDEVLHLTDPPVPHVPPVSFLHTLPLYRIHHRELPGAWDQLQPTEQRPNYTGVEVTTRRSVVFLSPRAFCDPALYLNENRPSFLEIHHHINTHHTSNTSCPQAVFSSQSRPLIELTQQIEGHWLNRSHDLQQAIRWTYVALEATLRIYPGTELNKDFMPQYRPWYRLAKEHPGLLTLTSPYSGHLLPHTPPIITLSRSLHHTPCQGRSREGVCAETAVMGMDLEVTYLEALVEGILEQEGVRCNKEYQCQDSLHTWHTCNTRCHVVSSSGDFVLGHPSTPVSMAARYGYIFRQLLQAGIFVKRIRTDYEGVCQHVHHSAQTAAVESDPMETMGPFPPFKNDFSCAKRVKYYTANLERLHTLGGIEGDLLFDACSSGHFYVADIPGTNTLLLVIRDYRDHSLEPFNINCYFQNSVLAPVSVMEDNLTCPPSTTNTSHTCCPLHSPPRQLCTPSHSHTMFLSKAFLFSILIMLSAEVTC